MYIYIINYLMFKIFTILYLFDMPYSSRSVLFKIQSFYKKTHLLSLFILQQNKNSIKNLILTKLCSKLYIHYL